MSSYLCWDWSHITVKASRLDQLAILIIQTHLEWRVSHIVTSKTKVNIPTNQTFLYLLYLNPSFVYVFSELTERLAYGRNNIMSSSLSEKNGIFEKKFVRLLIQYRLVWLRVYVQRAEMHKFISQLTSN